MSEVVISEVSEYEYPAEPLDPDDPLWIQAIGADGWRQLQLKEGPYASYVAWEKWMNRFPVMPDCGGAEIMECLEVHDDSPSGLELQTALYSIMCRLLSREVSHAVD